MIIAGLDLARLHDHTVLVLVKVPGTVIAVHQIPKGQSWDLIMEQCRRLLDHYRPHHVVADVTGVGDGVIDRLEDVRNANIQRFRFTAISKAALIRNLTAWISSGRLAIDPDCPGREILRDELMGLQVTATRTGHRVSGKYHGQKDDSVMALGMALLALTERTCSSTIYNPKEVAHDFHRT